jgi:hypothetical protein
MSRYQLDSIERRKDFLGDVDYKIPPSQQQIQVPVLH